MTSRGSSVDPPEPGLGHGWECAPSTGAEDAGLSRRELLKLAGLGLGAILAAPALAKGARPLGRSVVQQGSSLIIGRGAPSITLDPQQTNSASDREVIPDLYDTLVYVDRHGTFYPGLATSWQFNRDGRVLKLTLRNGVTFHDGTPFDADAVKFSFDRWRDPSTASPTAAAFLGTLSDVLVVDANTVWLIHSTRFAPVLFDLASPNAAIVSAAAVQKFGSQYGRNPIGTGAYEFVEWDADDTIRLKRNPAHTWSTPLYKTLDGKPLQRGPLIDTVEIRVVPSDPTRVAAFESNELDMIYGLDAVPANAVPGLRKRRDVQVRQAPGGVWLMLLNAAREPLTDPRTRQALSLAIDRKEIVALAFDGQALPGTSALASSYPDYDSTVAMYNQYDPDKARSLLRAAGQAKGFTIDYALDAGDASDADQRAAQLIQHDLSKINVKLNIRLLPTPTLVDDFLQKPLAQKSNAFLSAYTLSSGSDGGSQLQRLWGRGGFFALFQDDAQLDALFARQAVTLDRAKRRSLLSSIQRRIASQGYSLPLYEPYATVAAHDDVRNLRLDWRGQIHLQELERS